jgi:hypothetical protein
LVVAAVTATRSRGAQIREHLALTPAERLEALRDELT